MKILLTIPDDLGEVYQDEANARKLDLPAVLVGRLAAAGELDPRIRYVIVAGNVRERLENILHGGALTSAEDLLLKVSRLARIKFGDHQIELTPGQMEEMAWRAKKQGRTIEQMVQDAYQVFARDFFTLVR